MIELWMRAGAVSDELVDARDTFYHCCDALGMELTLGSGHETAGLDGTATCDGAAELGGCKHGVDVGEWVEADGDR